jgi:hypothetical protein
MIHRLDASYRIKAVLGYATWNSKDLEHSMIYLLHMGLKTEELGTIWTEPWRVLLTSTRNLKLKTRLAS